jgi:transposase
MTETESRWAARVEEWRASGKTAREFCEGKEFSAGGLRYWSSQLRSGASPARKRVRRRPRGARGSQVAKATETPKEALPAVVRGLQMAKGTGTKKEVRLARVVRGRQAETPETPIFIEVGHARVGVRRGFDAASLRVVLELLGGGR